MNEEELKKLASSWLVKNWKTASAVIAVLATLGLIVFNYPWAALALFGGAPLVIEQAKRKREDKIRNDAEKSIRKLTDHLKLENQKLEKEITAERERSETMTNHELKKDILKNIDTS